MKILIIGKKGQIASALQKVENSLFDITALGRSELDVKNTSAIEMVIKKLNPDVIINTAAFFVVSECENNPDEVFQTNVTAVYRLTLLCKKLKIKLITYSTDYVFDGEKGDLYTEDDKPNPLQIYGLSKVASEFAVRNYYPEGSFVIRTNGVFGGGNIGSSIKKSNFVLGILRDAREKQIIEVASDAIVSPTYATDLATATLSLLKNVAPPDIYHLVNEGYCTWREFAKTILSFANIDKQVEKPNFIPKETFKRPSYSALANIKAKSLGIVLPTWQDGLNRYIIKELLL